MKKINIGFLSAGIFAVLGIASCTNEVDQSYPLNNLNKPVVTIVADQMALAELDESSTADMDESVATFTVTADRAYNTATKYKVEFLENESSASLEDFEFSLDESPIDFGIDGFLITMPSNQTTTSFTITALFDNEFESTENLKFRIFPVGEMNGLVAEGSQNFELTISNSISKDLTLVFDWDKTFTIDGIDYTFCELEYDVDIIVYDESGAPFGPGAQTGDCPENLSINLDDYPNGTYTVTGYLYDDGPDGISQAGIDPAISIPMNVTYIREGSQTLSTESTFVQTNFFDTNTQEGTEMYIMTIVVQDGVFTIMNEGTTIASGRQAASKHVSR